MKNVITQIEMSRLLPHPGNPNRMSKENLRKLVRHIERTGRYEPLTVRPICHREPTFLCHCERSEAIPNSNDTKIAASFRKTGTPRNDIRYQIINGHHRFEALKQLGYETCDCVVWDIDDDEANLLLATLNRLCGRDVLEKKTALLEKLNRKLRVDELSKLLPNTKTQIQRLLEVQKNKVQIHITEQDKNRIAYPMVFFLNAEQKAIVEKAIDRASSFEQGSHRASSKAQRNAQAITQISKCFIENLEPSIPLSLRGAKRRSNL